MSKRAPASCAQRQHCPFETRAPTKKERGSPRPETLPRVGSPRTTSTNKCRAPRKAARRRAASKNADSKAKDGQKEKRCGAGYQRKNGRWEGRFRPTVRALTAVRVCPAHPPSTRWPIAAKPVATPSELTPPSLPSAAAALPSTAAAMSVALSPIVQSRFELPLNDVDIQQAFRGVKVTTDAKVYR